VTKDVAHRQPLEGRTRSGEALGRGPIADDKLGRPGRQEAHEIDPLAAEADDADPRSVEALEA
jgi:hypothetical protein